MLFAARCLRLFAYGALSVVLVLYLTSLGLSAPATGLLLTLTLFGDTAVSLYLTTRADRAGRRRTLFIGSALMIGAGVVFAVTRNFTVLLIAATIGVISPSGNEVGPFLAVEQAALAEVVDPALRTATFAWYTLAGALATALGSLCGGFLSQFLTVTAHSPVTGYRSVVVLYAAVGMLLAAVFGRVSSGVEVRDKRPAAGRSRWGMVASHGIVWRLSGLFALDAFGGAFVVQGFAAYWFYLRYGVNPAQLGSIFFVANLLAGVSALVASRLASRIGLVRTMVFTHLPSNVLLILVPVMPNLTLAVLVLFARFSISQMDVPTRQSYVMAVVRPEERSAAAGITGVARTTGAALAPVMAGWMFARPGWMNVPFFAAGALKIVYDLLLYRAFAGTRAEGDPDAGV
jgi:MFS family permease